MARFSAAVGGLEVRAGTPEDRSAVAALFARAEPEIPLAREAFGRLWEWLHFHAPGRTSDVFVAGKGDDDLRGHVAMLPVPFACEDTPLTAGWPCELMVDDRARGTLLYPVMVQQLLRLCKTHDYAFAYALINRPRVLAANIALGLKPIGELPVWVRPYRPMAMLPKAFATPAARLAARLLGPLDALLRLRPPGAARAVSIESIARFTPEIDELFARTLSPAFRFVALRTSERLNWRFFGAERTYHVIVARAAGRIVGYAALRVMPMRAYRALAVVDLWHDPAEPAAGRGLMREVHRFALAEQVDFAACLMAPHSPMAGLLREHWFGKSPESFTLTVYQPRREMPYGGTPLTDWHPTWFDHDYV